MVLVFLINTCGRAIIKGTLKSSALPTVLFSNMSEIKFLEKLHGWNCQRSICASLIPKLVIEWFKVKYKIELWFRLYPESMSSPVQEAHHFWSTQCYIFLTFIQKEFYGLTPTRRHLFLQSQAEGYNLIINNWQRKNIF